LAEAPHDFAEDDPEHFRRRLVIARKPAATRARIDASEMREVGFGFVWPGHAGEVAKANWCLRCRALGNSVCRVRRLPNLSIDLPAASSDNPMHDKTPHALRNTELEKR
jgi:hypothetical protein